MQYSAFTSIFRVFINASNRDSLQEIATLLSTVLVENSILQGSSASFHSLLSSFEGSGSEQLPSQLGFFDNCACRLTKKPVHYQDLIGSLSGSAPGPVSPLFAAISEQWPFVVKNGDGAVESPVGSWIAQALGKFKQAGENTRALKSVRDSCSEATENKKTKSVLKKALKGVEETEDDDVKMHDAAKDTSQAFPTKEQKVDLEDIFGPLPTEGTIHNALQRWEKDDLEVSVEQGRVAELMLCLCSEHEEVRRQAFSNLTRFMVKLKDCKYVEWRAVYLLAGELVETVRQLGLEAPVPWIVGECASSCLSVLTDPMHKLYGKVNRFLQKAPYWELEKIGTYWIDKVLLHEPELDDGYFEEINWLLDLFVKGLRTGTVCFALLFLFESMLMVLSRTWKSTGAPMSLNESCPSTNRPVPGSLQRDGSCTCCTARHKSAAAQP